jgi:hypothetical protein
LLGLTLIIPGLYSLPKAYAERDELALRMSAEVGVLYTERDANSAVFQLGNV